MKYEDSVKVKKTTTSNSEFCFCVCCCLSLEWKDCLVDENLNFILYSSVLKKRKTLKMKVTNPDVANIYVYIWNSKVTVILTGFVDRESKGSDAHLIFFLCHFYLLGSRCSFFFWALQHITTNHPFPHRIALYIYIFNFGFTQNWSRYPDSTLCPFNYRD